MAQTNGADGLAPVLVNVQDYGAIGNGATDDTAAIQAAIDAAAAAGPGNAVLFPYGPYLTTGGLTVPTGTSFVGTGHLYHGQCEIRLTASNASIFVVGGGLKDVSWTNLAFRATSLTGTRAIDCNGVYPVSSTGFEVSNCSFVGFDRGISIADESGSGWQCDNWLISHCRWNEGNYGVWFETKNASLTEMQGCFITALVACVHVQQSGPFTMIDCAGAGNAGTGTFVEVQTAYYDNITLIDCQAENIGYWLTVLGSTTILPPIVIMGCTLDAPIQLTASARIISIGNYYKANLVATAGGTASLVSSIMDAFAVGYSLQVTSPNKIIFGVRPTLAIVDMQGMGLNLGTATGAVAGQLILKGSASEDIIKAIPATGALTDPGYISVNDRARFGFDGAGSIVIDDNQNSKPITFKTANVERMRILATGLVGIGTTVPKTALHVVGLPVYANNAAAITGGLTAGAFYRTNADPDPVCVVH